MKKNKNYAMVSSALARLQESARGTDNLMPPILEAVREYATLGEICAVLREISGEYRDV